MYSGAFPSSLYTGLNTRRLIEKQTRRQRALGRAAGCSSAYMLSDDSTLSEVVMTPTAAAYYRSGACVAEDPLLAPSDLDGTCTLFEVCGARPSQDLRLPGLACNLCLTAYRMPTF
jgi:hypothetical protein